MIETHAPRYCKTITTAKSPTPKNTKMKQKLTSLIVGSLSGIALCLAPMNAQADPPTAFTLEWSGTTDPGVWSWSRNGTTWTVVYPSGARRLFREQKRSTVKGATGTIIENIGGT
jgi:hypothetical protein